MTVNIETTGTFTGTGTASFSITPTDGHIVLVSISLAYFGIDTVLSTSAPGLLRVSSNTNGFGGGNLFNGLYRGGDVSSGDDPLQATYTFTAASGGDITGAYVVLSVTTAGIYPSISLLSQRYGDPPTPPWITSTTTGGGGPDVTADAGFYLYFLNWSDYLPADSTPVRPSGATPLDVASFSEGGAEVRVATAYENHAPATTTRVWSGPTSGGVAYVRTFVVYVAEEGTTGTSNCTHLRHRQRDDIQETPRNYRGISSGPTSVDYSMRRGLMNTYDGPRPCVPGDITVPVEPDVGLFTSLQDTASMGAYSMATSLSVDETGSNLYVGYWRVDGSSQVKVGIYRYAIGADGNLDLGSAFTGVYAETDFADDYIAAVPRCVVAAVSGSIYMFVFYTPDGPYSNQHHALFVASGGSMMEVGSFPADMCIMPFQWDRGTDGNIYAIGGPFQYGTPTACGYQPSGLYQYSVLDMFNPTYLNSFYVAGGVDGLALGGPRMANATVMSGIGAADNLSDPYSTDSVIAFNASGGVVGSSSMTRYWNAGIFGQFPTPILSSDGTNFWVMGDTAPIAGDKNLLVSPTGDILMSSANSDYVAGEPVWIDASNSDDGTVAYGLYYDASSLTSPTFQIFRLYDRF